MNHLILIRHSITQQQADVSSHRWQLTLEGQTACKAAAAQLCDYGIAHVYTSDEDKARLTGQLIAEALELPVASAPNLHETLRHSVPYFPDVTDFQAAVKRAMRQPDELVFGEERFTDALNRFNVAIETLLTMHPDETIAVVTHGTVMSLFAAQYTSRDIYDIWASLDMPAYAIFERPSLSLIRLVSHVV